MKVIKKILNIIFNPINNISFGKKIPLTTCQIQDKKTGKFVPATLFEYDCKDEHPHNVDKVPI